MSWDRSVIHSSNKTDRNNITEILLKVVLNTLTLTPYIILKLMKFDDVILGVIFQVKKVELEDGTMTYCMWVSRDPEDAPEYGKSFTNLTLASSFNSTVDKSNCSIGEVCIMYNSNMTSFFHFVNK